MISLYPSQIIEYLYCPRFTFFEYVLRVPQQEDKFHKVKRGRDVHNEKLERNKEYLRKRLGVEKKWLDQYLGGDGLRGVVDEVLCLKDGSFAPLDYKFAQWNEKVYETYRQQLFCYAVLIEQNFNTEVHRGYLVYTRSKNKVVEVPISDTEKETIKESIESIRVIIEGNRFPSATKYKKRCVNCTYQNICIK